MPHIPADKLESHHATVGGKLSISGQVVCKRQAITQRRWLTIAAKGIPAQPSPTQAHLIIRLRHYESFIPICGEELLMIHGTDLVTSIIDQDILVEVTHVISYNGMEVVGYYVERALERINQLM